MAGRFFAVTNMSCYVRRWPGCVAAAMLVVLCAARTAAAQPDGDRHLWVQGVAVVRVSENWRVHLEEQPRWFDDVSAPFQNILRGAVGRQAGRRVSVWAGYGWVAKPPGPGVTHEQRTWQQVLATPPAMGRWTSVVRFRQEQRRQPDWDGTSHRLRAMVRTVRPLGVSGWSGVLWDEAMVTFNGTGGGPPKGFDQNRLFLGVNRRMSARANVDAGYMWFAVRQPSGQRSDGHVALTAVNLTF